MKKYALIILLAGNSTFITQAQDAIELTTYFAEKAMFKIDLPDHWTTTISEKKAIMSYSTIIISVDSLEEGTMLYVSSIMGCRSSANEAKSYKKIFEKNASKSNDEAFRIIAEGQNEDESEKKYNWLEYIHTLVMDDGTKIVLREMFYARCHTASATKYANVFRLSTHEENWDKNKPLFEEIYSSVRFLKKKDL